jgi:hypothetical protein
MSSAATSCRRPFADRAAGELLKGLREDLGLTPELMPHAMLRAGVDSKYIPSSRTIRRIEDVGVRPCVRYRFGLASFFERKQSSIWPSESRVAA